MRNAIFCFGLVLSLFGTAARAQANLDVSLGSVSVPNDANAEVELSVTGNGASRGLQIRLDFDDSNIDAVDLSDCLDGFVGVSQVGTICSHPPGQPGRIRILLNAGPGTAINDFAGVLRFQLDGSLPAGSVIELSWDEPFSTASNPDAAASQVDGQIEVLGPPQGDLAVAPEAVEFGEIQFGSVDQALLTVSNAGSASATPVEIAALELAGDPAFELTGGGNCQVGTVLEAQAPGCELEIGFAPTGAGDFSATLTVTSVSGQSIPVAITGQGLPATATVTLSDLVRVYTGQPLEPSVSTDPAGLDVTLTYDGQSAAPVDAGSYTVEAIISDPDYSGQSTALFEILGDGLFGDRFEAAQRKVDVSAPPML